VVVLGADLAVVEEDVQMAGIDHLVALPTEEECPIVGDAVLGVDRRNQVEVVVEDVVADHLIGEEDRLQRQ
jgi:hypothetical protein